MLAIVAAAVIAVPPPHVDPKAVAEVKAGRRKVANAAWWGFDPVNSTAPLQAAIDSGARKLVIPNMGADWVVDPITLASDQEIVLEKGVVISARKGGFPGTGDSLISAHAKRNVTLRGFGATLRMQKPEYTTGEWRMCLDLESCTNVKVLGLTLRDSGGDGIYIGNCDPKQPFCRDILVRDCVMDNNRRQGMSVITAVNLSVERCIFRNTSGTAPKAGVDLEPNGPTEKLVDCVFSNCTIENNDGPGILVYLGQLDETTEPISVRFVRCKVTGGKDTGLAIGGTHPKGPGGSIVFRDCSVESTQGSGLSVFQKAKDAVRLTFARCVWRSVARASSRTTPIAVEGWNGADKPAAGGIDFDDCVLEDDADRPAIRLDGNSGFADVTGRIRVTNDKRKAVYNLPPGVTVKVLQEGASGR